MQTNVGQHVLQLIGFRGYFGCPCIPKLIPVHGDLTTCLEVRVYVVGAHYCSIAVVRVNQHRRRRHEVNHVRDLVPLHEDLELGPDLQRWTAARAVKDLMAFLADFRRVL